MSLPRPYANAPKPPTTGRYAPKRQTEPPAAGFQDKGVKGPQTNKSTGDKKIRDNSISATGRQPGYWVAAGVASLGMSIWELLNFWALVRDYDVAPVAVGPFLYLFIFFVTLGSLVSAILVLARQKRPGRKLAGSLTWFAALGLLLFFFASLPSASGWGFYYFLESACVIIPVLVLMILLMRRPKPEAQSDRESTARRTEAVDK